MGYVLRKNGAYPIFAFELPAIAFLSQQQNKHKCAPPLRSEPDSFNIFQHSDLKLCHRHGQDLLYVKSY